MFDLTKLVRKSVSTCVSASLALSLCPVMDVGASCGESAFAQGASVEMEGGRDASTPGAIAADDAIFAPDEEAGSDASDASGEPDPPLADLEADREAFAEMGCVFEQAHFAYRTTVAWKDACVEGGAATSFRLSYSFKVDEEATSPLLDVRLADPFDAASLSVVPLDVFADAAHVKVDAFLDVWEGPVASIEFDVRDVAKKEVDELHLAALPFRLDEALQEERAEMELRRALEAPGSSFDAADLDNADGDLIEGFVLAPYPSDLAAREEGGFELGLSFQLCDALSQKYEVADDAMRMRIDGVERIACPQDLLFNGEDGSGWMAEDVIAQQAGHELSFTLDAHAFAKALPLNSAEGVYEGVELYAMDGDGVVTKLTNISYKVDKTAPSLVSFSVDGEHEEKGDAWFFREDASITAIVKDPDRNIGAFQEGGSGAWMPRPEVSGLVEEGARIEYASCSGTGRSAEGIILAGPHQEVGSMELSIEEDEDALIDSFVVCAKDAAGNELRSGISEAKEMPDHILRLVSDAAAPELFVSFDNNDMRNGRYLAAPRVGTFTVVEANFDYIQEYDPDQIIVSINEGGRIHVFRAKDFQSKGDDSWQVSYAFVDDAEYAVEAQAIDLAGKSSERFSSTFVIDKTAPSLSIAFDGEEARNGSYFNAARTAMITVAEADFSPDLIHVSVDARAMEGNEPAPARIGEWLSSGDEHVCTVFFPGQGTYEMSVSGTDLALNALPEHRIPAFTVDTESPRISVEVGGEEDARIRARSGDCAVRIAIEDDHVDPASTIQIMSIGLGGAVNPYVVEPVFTERSISAFCADPDRIPENDNIYRLQVEAVDMAGNVETKVVEWSVNRFGSTYLPSEETRSMLAQGYVKKENACDISVTEINPSGLQEDAVSVSLLTGARNRTLRRDEDYAFRISEVDGWPAYEYVVSKECFASDGTYQMGFRSMDNAGNASLNARERAAVDEGNGTEIVFCIDDTPPLVSFTAASDANLQETATEVKCSIEDNMKVSHALIHVPGREDQVVLADELAGAGTLSVPIEAEADGLPVTIEAFDAAGNASSVHVPPLQPDQALFPFLVVVTSVAALAVVGVAALVRAIARRRRRSGVR